MKEDILSLRTASNQDKTNERREGRRNIVHGLSQAGKSMLLSLIIREFVGSRLDGLLWSELGSQQGRPAGRRTEAWQLREAACP